ncbi:hypothetical protein B5E60_12725 [Alistipes sp. An116]|nr:hypothetical protein B5E60_12725 [Alistipes sp. An116]
MVCNCFGGFCHGLQKIVLRRIAPTRCTGSCGLEDDGYITRTVYPEVPPRVEYALTERTRSLLPHINSLIEWALENKDAIIKDRRKAHGK